VTLATGPAWTTATAGSGARGTGAGTTQLSRLNGFWVNTVQMTARNGSTTYTIDANKGTYVGTIAMDGTNGQLTCTTAFGQSRKFGVWNAYNRVPIVLLAGDATASWTYATATVRASNNDATNSLTTLCGLPEEFIDIRFSQFVTKFTNAAATAPTFIGIGLNVTNAFTGNVGSLDNFNGSGTSIETGANILAVHALAPGIGINTVTCCEKAPTAGTNTYFGGQDDMQMVARWNG
jgi:hypothetical protein